jgi:hypothetical protein
VLVTTFIINIIFDVCPYCIQEYTPCIFNLFINIGLFFFLVMNMPLFLLRSKLGHGFSLLKLIHHISIVILRWLRLDLFLQSFYLLFKPFDCKLKCIIHFTYSFITRFYNNLLNIWLLALSTKSININIIAFSQPLLVTALVVSGVLEGFIVLA